MKKLSLFFMALFLAIGVSFAQAPLGKGNAQLNAGFGFSSWGLPVYIGADFGVHPDITVGFEGSFRSRHHKDYNYNVFGFSGNGNYHFNNVLNMPSEFDFYAGVNVGFYVHNYPSDYPYDKTSGLGIGGQIGGRWFFTNKVGLNLEFGGGNAFAGGKIGLTFVL